MSPSKIEKLLLWSGFVAAILYFGNAFGIGAIEPNYSHIRQMVSELGMAHASHPALFNTIAVLSGAMFFATGTGFYLAIKRLTGRRVLSVFAGVFVGLFGMNGIFAGAFPAPDPRHTAFGVGLFTFFVPWLMAWGFWKFHAARLANMLQLVAGFVIIGILVFQIGLFGFVDKTNIGLFQRIAVSVFDFWLLATCYWLLTWRQNTPTVTA